MIKIIPFLAYIFFIPFEAYSLDSDFYKDLYEYETGLDSASKEEGKIQEAIAKRLTHKFFNSQMRGEDLAKDFEVFISQKNIGSIDDLMKALEEFLTKILGSKMAAVIIKVIGMADSAQAIKDIFAGIKQMQDPVTCDNGFYNLSGGLAHVVTMVLVYYFFWSNPMAGLIATPCAIVARQSMILINDLTELPKIICDVLHKREFYEIYSY